MAYAEMALAQIRALRQCAMPRNYEIWYVYATGYNPELNKAINEAIVEPELKAGVEEALEARRSQLEEKRLAAQLESERIDVTLPSRLPHAGALHPITQTTRKIVQVFSRLGFDAAVKMGCRLLGAHRGAEPLGGWHSRCRDQADAGLR